MATMFDIDEAAMIYGLAHEALSGEMKELEFEISELKRENIARIRKHVRSAAEKKEALRVLIDDSRELFDKPKTRVLHGIKLGIQKGKGKIEWDDEAVVIKLIKKHFGDQAETMIKSTERIVKDSLATMAAADLKRIGVRVEDTGDQIVIKPTDSEIDKLVDALLADDEAPEAA